MLFTFIRRLFSSDLIIELSEKKITVREFSSDQMFEFEPVMAIEHIEEPRINARIVKAIGEEVHSLSPAGLTVINPFKHTRSFVANYEVAEKMIQYGIQKMQKSWIRPAPRIVMHQLEKVDGGLTSVESKVLKELALGAGARKAVVYTGIKINCDSESYDSIESRMNKK